MVEVVDPKVVSGLEGVWIDVGVFFCEEDQVTRPARLSFPSAIISLSRDGFEAKFRLSKFRFDPIEVRGGHFDFEKVNGRYSVDKGPSIDGKGPRGSVDVTRHRRALGIALERRGKRQKLLVQVWRPTPLGPSPLGPLPFALSLRLSCACTEMVLALDVADSSAACQG